MTTQPEMPSDDDPEADGEQSQLDQPEVEAEEAASDEEFTDDAGEEHDEEDDGDDDFSLDDLGAAYAEAMAEAGLLPDPPPESEATQDAESEEEVDEPVTVEEVDLPPPTPEGIVEAALFLGHPENQPLSARELARVMRDVSPKEVDQIIKDLNRHYAEQESSIRVVKENGGYRLVLSQDVDAVRKMFYGKVREARLSQSALEILSLVAYQPGISAIELGKQRGGKECGPLLNQLVRRRLLEVTREKAEGGGRAVSYYHPTERFLNLFGLTSLEDLPRVDEGVSMI